MNPYASVGSVKTVAASVSGSSGASGGPDGRGGDGAVASLSTWQVVRRLLRFVRRRLPLLVIAFAAAAVSVAFQLYVPILVGRAIDLMLGPGAVDFNALSALLARLAAAVVIASALQWAQGIAIAQLTYRTVRDIRVEADAKLFRVPLAYLDSHAHGDLMARVVNDVDQMGDGMLQGATQLFSGVATVVGTLIFMLVTSVPMALLVVLVTPLSVLAAGCIARWSARSFTAQQRIQGNLGGYVEEHVGNLRLVQTFARGPEACRGFGDINEELRGVGERAQFLSSLSNPGTRFINNIIYAVVAVVGFAGVITGFPAALTVGEVQVFLSYANQYTKPFNEITGVISQIQTAIAAARRVFSLIDAAEEEPDAPDALEPAPGPGSVEFRHVGFSYDPARPLLEDICFTAEPGTRVALVGPTGCGKTTLINLLLRFYDSQVGEILVDGVPVAGMTRRSLRSRFGMVLQESWLFEGTVHDNIAFSRPGASRAEVERAARRAHADAFIQALPQGYDTVLGGDGGSLSQGQRQLLCIARVMLAAPSILLLDEATSSIDTRTELAVQAAFDELMRDRTSLVVAHRLSTVRDADLILVMRDGRIIERGTHDELLAQDGFYAELYRSQWSDADDGEA